MELKDRLIQLRKENKMTQAELADTLNISRQAVSRWETGIAAPSTVNLLELSKIYGVSVDAILNNDSIEEKSTGENAREKTAEQRHQGERWQNRKLATILLVLAIITVIGVVICIAGVKEPSPLRHENMDAVNYMSPEKSNNTTRITEILGYLYLN